MFRNNNQGDMSHIRVGGLRRHLRGGSPLPPLLLAQALVLAVLMPGCSSFKLKTHVFTANKVLVDIDRGSASAAQFLRLGMLSNVSIGNPFVVDALRRYPSAFRAGVLGPDCFPDMIGGQQWVHIDKGAADGVPAGVPFEKRTFAQWRSIDYGEGGRRTA
jgi:hypothetical protein